jgi:ComF family protein
MPAEILIPVPMHPKRLRERGYNQARLLARGLSRRSGLPLADGCLLRQRHTPPQARTGSAAERRNNIAAAFICGNDRAQGKAVLLIDDVATSGATLDACAAVLKGSGAASVWGLVTAREI